LKTPARDDAAAIRMNVRRRRKQRVVIRDRPSRAARNASSSTSRRPALDIITARQILDLFGELQAETKSPRLYISARPGAGPAPREPGCGHAFAAGSLEQGDVEAVFRKAEG